MQKIVLLTGSQGFTGCYVRTALENDGFKVIGLVQKTPKTDEVEADLLDITSLRTAVAQVQPTHVIHLAAIAFVAHASAEDFYRVNLFGTLNLLEAIYAEKPTIEKILLSSSSNVYGNPIVSIVTESTPPAPINHYAMSKLAMEHMARTWSDRLPIAFTRPFNYTGVGQGHSLTEVIHMCEAITDHRIKVKVNPAFVRANELRVLIGDPERLNTQLPDLPKIPFKETLSWMLG